MSSGDSRWIKLNVRGQPFLTIILSCPDSLLSKMFDPESDFEPAHKENGVYFLDVNPKYFGIILDWMSHREIIAESEINLNNVAKIADYFGLVELVEEIKKSQNPPWPVIGQWMKKEDISPQNKVAAMSMRIIASQLQATIVQCSNGLTISEYLIWGEVKHLSLNLEGRCAAWIQTTTGRIPPEAIAVEGEGGNRMFIGRRLWLRDGPQNASAVTVFEYEDGDTILPGYGGNAYISVGYVNDKGIWSINFSKSVDAIVKKMKIFGSIVLPQNLRYFVFSNPML